MTFGFIGLGNMASAIIGGMRAASFCGGGEILGFDIDPARASLLGAAPCRSAAACAALADVTVLAVKPQTLEAVLGEIAGVLGPDRLLVSIAAGKPIAFYESRVGSVPS
jgi:pyrroline-5-carboxylate reductase